MKKKWWLIVSCLIATMIGLWLLNKDLFAVFTFLCFVVLIFFALVRVEKIEDGFCALIMRLGQFRKCVMRWEGHRFQKKPDAPGEDWWVEEDPTAKERKTFGGLVFMWRFEKPHDYTLTWKTLKEGGAVSLYKREPLKRVLLKAKVYFFEISNAEDGKLMPLKLGVLVTLRVVNPLLAISSLDDYLQVVADRLAPASRNAVTQGEYQELIKKAQDIGEEIFQSSSSVLDELKNKHGVEVVKIDLYSIDPEREEDRKATLAPIQAAFQKEADKINAEAKAAVKKIEAEADAFVKELLAKTEATAIEQELGQAHQNLVARYEQAGFSRVEANEKAIDLMKIKIETKTGSLIDIRTPDAGAIDGSLLSLLALWKKFDPGSGAGKPATGKQGAEKKKNQPPDYTGALRSMASKKKS